MSYDMVAVKNLREGAEVIHDTYGRVDSLKLHSLKATCKELGIDKCVLNWTQRSMTLYEQALCYQINAKEIQRLPRKKKKKYKKNNWDYSRRHDHGPVELPMYSSSLNSITAYQQMREQARGHLQTIVAEHLRSLGFQAGA